MTDNKKLSADEYYRMFRALPICADAHGEWAQYRCAVTDFILKNCDAGSSLAVYGAGRCNDIDLARLSEHFSEIVLIDADAQALDEAVPKDDRTADDINDNAGQTVTGRNNIRRAVFNLTGLDENACVRYIDYILDRVHGGRSESDSDDFLEGLEEFVRNIYAEDFHPRGIVPVIGRQCDYSVAVGLHSQLNTVFSGLTSFVLGHLGTDRELRIAATERIEALQRGYTDRLVQTADDIMLDATLKGIILGFEYEARRDGKVFTNIDGALQCAADFEQLQKDGLLHVDTTEHLIWNVDAERRLSYDMLLVLCQWGQVH